MKQLGPAFRILIFFTAVFGFIYPAIIWACGQIIAPKLARGDFIEKNGQVVGARMVAQNFTSPKYFWGRPSAVNFDPMASGGSNLGPTSAALKKAVDEREVKIRALQHVEGSTEIPQDLLFASASGLDPEISPEATRFQVDRVAAARGISSDSVRQMIEARIVGPQLGFLGEPRVNVLELNLALDELGAPGSGAHSQ